VLVFLLIESTQVELAGKMCQTGVPLKSDRNARNFRGFAGTIGKYIGLASAHVSLEISVRFPESPVPAGHTMDSFYHHRLFGLNTYAAMSTRLSVSLKKNSPYHEAGFPGYFLIVWTFINFCPEHNIMVQAGEAPEQQQFVIPGNYTVDRWKSSGVRTILNGAAKAGGYRSGSSAAIVGTVIQEIIAATANMGGVTAN